MSEQRHIAITGGTGGLGTAVVGAFLEQGDIVHASYIVDEERDNFEYKDHDNITLTKVNLLDEGSVQEWFDGLPGCQVLVNIAGGFAMGPFQETTLKTWQHMMNLNLTTAFLTSRAAINRMLPENHGRIINIGAFAATNRTGGMAAYTASKAALLNFTQSLAEETITNDITVNAVLPTVMDTPGNRVAMPDADTRTWVKTENVARLITFLTAPESGDISGALIPIRGRM